MGSPLPREPLPALLFLIRTIASNPFVFAGLALAFLASLSWMAALSKLPLSRAYPFMALSYVAVFALAPLLLQESVTPVRWLGIALIVLGVTLAGRA